MRIDLFRATAVAALVLAGLGAGANNLAPVADLAEQGNSAAVLALVKKGADVKAENNAKCAFACSLCWMGDGCTRRQRPRLRKALLSNPIKITSIKTPNYSNPFSEKINRLRY